MNTLYNHFLFCFCFWIFFMQTKNFIPIWRIWKLKTIFRFLFSLLSILVSTKSTFSPSLQTLCSYCTNSLVANSVPSPKWAIGIGIPPQRLLLKYQLLDRVGGIVQLLKELWCYNDINSVQRIDAHRSWKLGQNNTNFGRKCQKNCANCCWKSQKIELKWCKLAPI